MSNKKDLLSNKRVAIIAHPGKRGFKNMKKYCERLSFDAKHIFEKIEKDMSPHIKTFENFIVKFNVPEYNVFGKCSPVMAISLAYRIAIYSERHSLFDYINNNFCQDAILIINLCCATLLEETNNDIILVHCDNYMDFIKYTSLCIGLIFIGNDEIEMPKILWDLVIKYSNHLAELLIKG